MVGVPEVIGIKKGHQRPCGNMQGGIPRLTGSAEGSSQEAYAGEVRLNELGRLVAGAIIGDDDLTGRLCLAQSGAHCRNHKGAGIPTGDDNRDVHHADTP